MLARANERPREETMPLYGQNIPMIHIQIELPFVLLCAICPVSLLHGMHAQKAGKLRLLSKSNYTRIAILFYEAKILNVSEV